MLKFVNATDQDLWVAYMFKGDTCEGDGWQGIGWFHMSPGGNTVVYANSLSDVDNRYWYYYAHSGDGSLQWSGPYLFQVPADGSAFNRCQSLGNNVDNVRQIGMRQFDVGDSDVFTMTLTR